MDVRLITYDTYLFFLEEFNRQITEIIAKNHFILIEVFKQNLSNEYKK